MDYVSLTYTLCKSSQILETEMDVEEESHDLI